MSRNRLSPSPPRLSLDAPMQSERGRGRVPASAVQELSKRQDLSRGSPLRGWRGPCDRLFLREESKKRRLTGTRG